MELWTAQHAYTLLPSVVVMLIVCVILRKTLGNKSDAVRMIPFQVLACVLLVLEIGKQVISLVRGYDLYHLPFHFCSLFIFMLPLMAFYHGKHVQAVRGLTAALCASVFLLLMIYPSLIYSAWDIEHFFDEYMAFHTVAFHNIVVMEFFLIVAMRLHTPATKREQTLIMVFILAFCVVCGSMSQLLKTNYNNMYECNVPPLETLRLSLQPVLGYGVTQLLYVLIVTVVDIGFVLMCYWLYRAARRLFK